jgi:hypothetical protein
VWLDSKRWLRETRKFDGLSFLFNQNRTPKDRGFPVVPSNNECDELPNKDVTSQFGPMIEPEYNNIPESDRQAWQVGRPFRGLGSSA